MKYTLEIDIRMIEQEHFDRATIVLVDNSSTSVNEMLEGYTSTFGS